MGKRVRVFSFAVILTCCLMAGVRTTAQNSGPPNDLDKNYVPDKASLFNESNPGNVSGKSGAPVDYHNVIEWTPGLIFRNIFALHYERKLTRFFSVQGALGAVFGKDRMQQIENPTGDFFSGTNSQTGSSVPLGTMLSQGTFVGPNVFLGVAARLYFSGWSNYASRYENYSENRIYIDFGIRHYGNTITVSSTPNNSGGAEISGTPTVNIRSTMYYLNWGYHLETEGKIVTTHNFFMGVGLRNSSYEAFKSTNVTGAYGNTTTINSVTTTRESITLPTIHFGYELGFGFK